MSVSELGWAVYYRIIIFLAITGISSDSNFYVQTTKN